MKLPNNGGNGVPTGHILSSNQASSTRIDLHLFKLSKWRGSHGNFQVTQAVVKSTGCSPETDCNASLLQTIPIQQWNIEKLSWSIHSLHSLHASVFSTGRYSVHFQRRNVTSTQPKPL